MPRNKTNPIDIIEDGLRNLSWETVSKGFQLMTGKKIAVVNSKALPDSLLVLMRSLQDELDNFTSGTVVSKKNPTKKQKKVEIEEADLEEETEEEEDEYLDNDFEEDEPEESEESGKPVAKKQTQKLVTSQSALNKIIKADGSNELVIFSDAPNPKMKKMYEKMDSKIRRVRENAAEIKQREKMSVDDAYVKCPECKHKNWKRTSLVAERLINDSSERKIPEYKCGKCTKTFRKR